MSLSAPSPPLSALTGRQMSWIAAGYVMSLSTMPGQTVFISQFNPALRATFGLSNGQFGLIYTAGTLLSSIVLVFAGGLVDRLSPRLLAALCLLGLAATGIGLTFVNNIVLLALAIFGLRFFGQGMLSQIGMTTLSRWFNRFRGRALAIAQLGFPTGEAIFPLALTLAIASFGWRPVWHMTALVLIVAMLPLIALLLADPPDGPRARKAGRTNPDAAATERATGMGWTRGAVLRDPLFLAVIPGFMGPPAIGTLYIFHQAHLAALKGWDLTQLTAFFPVLALGSVLSALISGVLIDRFGAWRILRFLLIPEGIGCLVIGLVAPIWAVPVFFAAFGTTMGAMSTVLGAYWAEIYGTAHLGAIRALATAAFVLASAVGPGLAGVLIDAHFDLGAQSFYYAAFCFVAAALYMVLTPRFAARARTISAQS